MLSAPIVRFAGLSVWVDVPLSELKSVKNLDRELWAVDASSSVSSWKINKTAMRAKSRTLLLTVKVGVGRELDVVLGGALVVEDGGSTTGYSVALSGARDFIVVSRTVESEAGNVGSEVKVLTTKSIPLVIAGLSIVKVISLSGRTVVTAASARSGSSAALTRPASTRTAGSSKVTRAFCVVQDRFASLNFDVTSVAESGMPKSA